LNYSITSSARARTEIWGLLYAQVKQADNSEFRNILLDDRVLDVNVQVEHEKTAVWIHKYTADERITLKRASLRNAKDDMASIQGRNLYKLAETQTVNKDATKFGTTVWSDAEVTYLLAQYGLPPNSPLSVVCVETAPHITNLYEHVSALHKPEVRDKMRTMVGSDQLPADVATNRLSFPIQNVGAPGVTRAPFSAFPPPPEGRLDNIFIWARIHPAPCGATMLLAIADEVIE
jgi:hypothetical protein